MGNHQIPSIIENLFDWVLQMPLGICFAFEQVARPRIMTTAPKCVANPAAVFTGDEDSHQRLPRAAAIRYAQPGL